MLELISLWVEQKGAVKEDEKVALDGLQRQGGCAHPPMFISPPKGVGGQTGFRTITTLPNVAVQKSLRFPVENRADFGPVLALQQSR
ncbi:MAG TPA: hypothetical protein DCZ69_06365 [Syntrophobacteraceae bacterium]|nr:hypothetical protein [Syntrophobacteraceae bacterium]